MKKIISIILLIALTFTFSSVFPVVADSDTSEYKKLIYDFEDGKTGIAWSYGSESSEFWNKDITEGYGLSGTWMRVSGSKKLMCLLFSPGDWHDEYYGDPIAFTFDVYGVQNTMITLDNFGLTYYGKGISWKAIIDPFEQPQAAKSISAKTVTKIRVDVADNVDWSKYSDSTITGKHIFFGFTANNSNGDVLIDNFSAVYKEPQENVETDGMVSDAVVTKAEASIRLNSQSGIRFYTAFDESKINGTVVEKGTLIGAKNKIGSYLTIDDTVTEAGASPNAISIPYKSNNLWANNEYVGSIVSVKPTNYAREFSARAYLKLDDGTYLYSPTTVTKTLADIADAFINDNSEFYNELDSTTKEIINTWAMAND